MRIDSINISQLVEITAQVLLKHNIQEPGHISQENCETNIWFLVASAFLQTKNFEYSDFLSFRRWWLRNTNSYATLTKARLKSLIEQSMIFLIILNIFLFVLSICNFYFVF